MYYLPLVLGTVLLIIPKISKRLKVIAFTVPLILLTAFRFGIGADYFSYQVLYESMNVSSLASLFSSNERIEFGYRILQGLFVKADLSYQVFTATISILCLILITRWIFKTSQNPLLSCLLFYAMFYFVWILSAHRQMIVLTIGTTYFFSNTKHKSVLKSIALVLLLSTIHLSALMYLSVIIIDALDIKWNKKNLMILFIASLIFSIIPLGDILSKISFIPSRITDYFNTSFKLTDFASVIRIGYFLFIIFFYDKITNSFENKRLVDYTLLGFIFFFFLSFSGIGAARFVIYFFILTVITLPMILDTYLDSKVLYRLGLVASIAYCSLFTLKETRTAISQSGYISDSAILTFESIFDKDYRSFNNIHARYLLRKEEDTLLFRKRGPIEQSRQLVPFDETDSNIVVSDRFTGKFGVMNEDGDWSVYPDFKSQPTLYGSVLVETIPLTYSNKIVYHDLSGQNRSQEAMLLDIQEHLLEETLFNQTSETYSKEIEYEALPDSVKQLIPEFEFVKAIQEVGFSAPFNYKIIGFNYYDKQYYVYVNEDDTLISDMLSIRYLRISKDGFLRIQNTIGVQIVNKRGEVIWFS